MVWCVNVRTGEGEGMGEYNGMEYGVVGYGKREDMRGGRGGRVEWGRVW